MLKIKRQTQDRKKRNNWGGKKIMLLQVKVFDKDVEIVEICSFPDI